MRIIVNESQYNKILIEEKKNTATFNNWVNYMSDVLGTHIHQFNVKEDVTTHTNLSNKLREKTFFKELPIENFIINLVENVNIEEIKISFNPYWSLLIETPTTFILKDIELDVELPSRKINGINEINLIKSQLRKEFIKINRWRNSSTLLKEQEDKDPFLPYTWDEGVKIDFDLYDDVAALNNFFNNIIDNGIHIIGGKEGVITIDDTFTLAEKILLNNASIASSTPIYLGFKEGVITASYGIEEIKDDLVIRKEEFDNSLKDKNIYFVNLDDVWGMGDGIIFGNTVIKGKYPIFEKVEDIPTDFQKYYTMAFVNESGADLSSLTDEEIMSDFPPKVKIHDTDAWARNEIIDREDRGDTKEIEWINGLEQFAKAVEIMPNIEVKGSNGNLKPNELKEIGVDVDNGTKEYLVISAADKYLEMEKAAKAEGITFKLKDGYRECGHPDDYKNGKWSQWAAWIKYSDHKGNEAARPNPDSSTEWIKQGGGKCTSNHGWGKAIDIEGSKAQKWITKNGCKYNWWWGEVPSEDWHFTYYAGIYSKARGASKRCGKKLPKKEFTLPVSGVKRGRYEFYKGSEKVDPNFITTFFISKGLTPEQAAGITGNIQSESAATWETGVIGDNGKSMGLAQWNKSRLIRLHQFAKDKGKEITDPNTQLEYLWHELQNKENKAYKKLLETKTAKEAGISFMVNFERPASKNNKTKQEKRGTQAEEALKKYKGE